MYLLQCFLVLLPLSLSVNHSTVNQQLGSVFVKQVVQSKDKDDLVQSIRNKNRCEGNAPLVLVFLNTGECVKCAAGVGFTIDSTREILVSPICVVAVVQCTRESELKTFVSSTEWDGGTFADLGGIKRKLEIPEDTRIAVLSADGKLLGVISRDEFNPTAYEAFRRLLLKDPVVKWGAKP